ncbi:hypothetical protein BJY01DRAFT_233407 [Aspergillus pseudoustus]|uniref:Uncharacterized protein n=1 Tax=Aspergillus pseudoustus TaxID=1810923 RepID=A0ABR4KC79_9EURO
MMGHQCIMLTNLGAGSEQFIARLGLGDPNPLTITRDPAPLVLDAATRTLYNHAISDPPSLTDQQRRLITYRPPPEEEDALCRNACGLSMDELIAKATNSKNNNNNNNNKNNNDDDDNFGLTLPLSEKEARLLIVGVSSAVQGQTFSILSEVARLSPKDRELKELAMQAARTDDVRIAREVATDVQQRRTAVRRAAAKALDSNDIRNIKVAMKVPWQEHVLQSSSTLTTSASDSGSSFGGRQGPSEAEGRFGLVVFYPENEEGGGGRLSEYKSQIRTAIYHSLHYSPSLVQDETRNRFALHWVIVPTTSGSNNNHDEIQDPSALRRIFHTMLSNNKIPNGFRRDSFLYVDEEAFRSRETARPYLLLAEPEPEPQPKTERHLEREIKSESKPEHESGIRTGAQSPSEALPPLKVDIKHIAPTLFARLVQRDLQGEARRKPYRYTSELSELHAATGAYAKWGNGEGDGIWPPPSRMQ